MNWCRPIMRAGKYLTAFLFLAAVVVTTSARAEQVAGYTPEEAPGEVINRVIMIIGENPVTQLDLDRIQKYVRAIRPDMKGSEKETAYSILIERAIVDRAASEESIIVSPERLENEIKRRMDMSNINNREQFEETVAKESGMPFDLWLEKLRYDLLRQQIIQIMISVPQPDEKDIEEFYRKNRRKIGEEVRYREIVFPPTRDISQERVIANKAKSIYQKVSSNPALFSQIARTTAENVSPRRYAGGLQNWTGLDQVAREDRITAGVLYSMRGGTVSNVYRDQAGRYRIVYLEGKRPVPLEEVRQLIERRLYFEQAEKAFDQWLEEEKKRLTIEKK